MNKTISKVFIAADHRGVGVKLYLTEMLAAAGYNVVNLGTDDPNTPVDFPDTAAENCPRSGVRPDAVRFCSAPAFPA